MWMVGRKNNDIVIPEIFTEPIFCLIPPWIQNIRHCERSEAIQLFFSNQRKAGLLRFARNDVFWIHARGSRTFLPKKR